MKIKITYSLEYDMDSLMPEIKSWIGDYPITNNAIEEFVKDRFISPELLDKNPSSKLSLEYL